MNTFIEYLGKFDFFFKASLSVFCLIGIWLFFYKKSGSPYSMLDKLWSIFVGKKDFYNGSISRFHNERHDIDKFNSIYNLNAINTKQIENFIKWIDLGGYDTRKISGIKGWFDIAKLTAKKPKVGHTIFLSTCVISLYFSCLFFGLWGFSPNAVVKLDKHDAWFFINHQKAKAVFTDPVISKENCEDKNYNREKFSSSSGIAIQSVNSICKAFNDKKELSAIDTIVKGQRVLLYVAAIALFLALHFSKFLIRRINAHDFYNLYYKN